QPVVQFFATPSLPSKAATLPGPHHMTSNLLFHPVLDERKAPTGVANREVSHPATQDRVDGGHQPRHWFRAISPKDFSQFPQQLRSLLRLRSVLRPQCPATSADTT